MDKLFIYLFIYLYKSSITTKMAKRREIHNNINEMRKKGLIGRCASSVKILFYKFLVTKIGLSITKEKFSRKFQNFLMSGLATAEGQTLQKCTKNLNRFVGNFEACERHLNI